MQVEKEQRATALHLPIWISSFQIFYEDFCF